MYSELVRFTVTGKYGCGPENEDDVYTVQEFQEFCESGLFVDYDGFGHPVKDSKLDPDICVKPSKLDLLPRDATHVVWYNR